MKEGGSADDSSWSLLPLSREPRRMAGGLDKTVGNLGMGTLAGASMYGWYKQGSWKKVLEELGLKYQARVLFEKGTGAINQDLAEQEKELRKLVSQIAEDNDAISSLFKTTIEAEGGV